MVNILGSICLLYIFSWLFIAIDNFIDNIIDIIKYKILKHKQLQTYSLDTLFKDINKKSLRNYYLYVYRFFIHIKEAPTDIRYNIMKFIQRGIRGYAVSDIWGFNYYLSKVIVDGLKDLKQIVHGYPSGSIGIQAIAIDEKNDAGIIQWKQILDEIIWTFEVTQKIQEREWIYIPLAKHREQYKQKNLEYHIMTVEEIKRYKKGWKLFQEYYFGLWD